MGLFLTCKPWITPKQDYNIKTTTTVTIKINNNTKNNDNDNNNNNNRELPKKGGMPMWINQTDIYLYEKSNVTLDTQILSSWLKGNPRYIGFLDLTQRKPQTHRFPRSWLKNSLDTQMTQNQKKKETLDTKVPQLWLQGNPRYMDYLELAKKKGTLDTQVPQELT